MKSTLMVMLLCVALFFTGCGCPKGASKEQIGQTWRETDVNHRHHMLQCMFNEKYRLNQEYSARFTILKGMNQEEVIALLGEPDEIKERTPASVFVVETHCSPPRKHYSPARSGEIRYKTGKRNHWLGVDHKLVIVFEPEYHKRVKLVFVSGG